MNQEKWTNVWRVVAAVALALSGFATAMAVVSLSEPEEPVARGSYSCAVYTEQGCAKFVVADGGELEVQSGGILDVQSGATSSLGAAMELNSTLNVDGAVTLNSTLDVDGNVSSGTGAVTVTDSLNVTGAVTLDSTLDVDGNVSSGTGAVTVTDSLNVTGAVDLDSTLNVDSSINYGSNDLYPLGAASDGCVLYCSTSGTFTATTTITSGVHGLTTPTAAIALMVTSPTTTAYQVSGSLSGYTLTLATWNANSGAGTTGVSAYYCVYGEP